VTEGVDVGKSAGTPDGDALAEAAFDAEALGSGVAFRQATIRPRSATVLPTNPVERRIGAA
jgi:hypothetical protein